MKNKRMLVTMTGILSATALFGSLTPIILNNTFSNSKELSIDNRINSSTPGYHDIGSYGSGSGTTRGQDIKNQIRNNGNFDLSQLGIPNLSSTIANFAPIAGVSELDRFINENWQVIFNWTQNLWWDGKQGFSAGYYVYDNLTKIRLDVGYTRPEGDFHFSIIISGFAVITNPTVLNTEGELTAPHSTILPSACTDQLMSQLIKDSNLVTGKWTNDIKIEAQIMAYSNEGGWVKTRVRIINAWTPYNTQQTTDWYKITYTGFEKGVGGTVVLIDDEVQSSGLAWWAWLLISLGIVAVVAAASVGGFFAYKKTHGNNKKSNGPKKVSASNGNKKLLTGPSSGPQQGPMPQQGPNRGPAPGPAMQGPGKGPIPPPRPPMPSARTGGPARRPGPGQPVPPPQRRF